MGAYAAEVTVRTAESVVRVVRRAHIFTVTRLDAMARVQKLKMTTVTLLRNLAWAFGWFTQEE